MKQSVRLGTSLYRGLLAAIALSAFLLSTLVHAEVLHNGRVYQTTADRIIAERHLQCTYGAWQSATLPTGATVLSRGKVCK